MTAVIMVELPAADSSSPYVQSLLESCEAGAKKQARCLLAPRVGGAEVGALVAIVTWDGPSRVQAHLTVGLLARGTPLWRTRVVDFAEDDPEEERWRSVGFALATLFGENLAGPEIHAPPALPVDAASPPATAFAPANSPAAGEVPPDNAHRAEPHSDPRWWIDVQFVAGATVPSGGPLLGGAMGLSRRLDSRWFVDGALAFDVLKLEPYRLVIVRPRATLGGGIALPLGDRFRLALRAEGVLQLIEVQGADSSGATDVGGRFVTGLRQSVDVEWATSDIARLTVGAAATEVAGATDIVAHGQPVVRLSATDFTGEFGLRISVP